MGEQSNLASLLERVKAATEADPDLGHEIVRALLDREARRSWTGNPILSLDAALALMERLDPEALVKLSNERMGWWIATVRLSTGAVCKTAALAVLAALLSSLVTGHKAAQAARAAQMAGEGSRDEPDPSLPNPLIRG